MELAKSFEPHAIEAKWYPIWESRGYFKPSGAAGRAAVLHSAAAAQRHRHAAHGPRVPADADGRADALPPDARLRYAVAARHRPCRHRHTDRRRKPAARRRDFAARSRPRRISSSGCGRGRRSPARRSRARCAGSARQATGRASASRWTKGCPPPCAKRSCGCTTTASSIAASGSSTGIRSSARRCPISRSKAKRSRASSGKSVTRWPMVRDRSRWPPRDPKRCWATWPSRSIPTTSAIGR